MAILIIAGSYKQLQELNEELVRTGSLSSEFNSSLLHTPDLTRYDRWHDFLYHLDYLIKSYISDKLPD